MRRIVGAASIIAVLIIAGIGIWLAVDRFGRAESNIDAEDELDLVSVAVRKTDIIDTETLSGTLGYTDPRTLHTRLAGTITALPDAGSTLQRGSEAFEIDGDPIVIMWGDRPAWRPFSIDMADGVDVRQLETNLTLFGFTDEDFVVDEEFTEETATLVEEWQADLGFEETGSIVLGRVIFIPTEVRVAQLLVEVGATVAPGQPILTTTAARQQVQLWLDADRQDLLDTGDAVVVELPDETRATGLVTKISSVVTTLVEGANTRRVFEVTIQLDDPAAASGLDEAPVDIEIASQEATDVLVVPVNALVALAEGGYAVELLNPDNTTRFVTVEIGEFADGIVAVTGEINEGDRVLVPR